MFGPEMSDSDLYPSFQILLSLQEHSYRVGLGSTASQTRACA